MFVGGLGRDRLFFERTAASAQSAMLQLAAAALVMPAVFELVDGSGLPRPGAERIHYTGDVITLSYITAGVLIACYVAGLIFSLKTHRGLFNPVADDDEHEGEPWSVRKAVLALAVAGAAV